MLADIVEIDESASLAQVGPAEADDGLQAIEAMGLEVEAVDVSCSGGHRGAAGIGQPQWPLPRQSFKQPQLVPQREEERKLGSGWLEW